MKKTTAIVIAAAFVLGGLVAAGALFVPFAPVGKPAVAARLNEPHPVWTEVAWPFPIDQWGKGKAFRCGAADCGAEVNLYVRAKIGFCNCTTGVSDDEELDRISDYDLIGNKLSALAAGREIKIAWMKGRSRLFAMENAAGKSAISVGFNDHCDAMIATAVVDHSRPGLIEDRVIEFLNGERVLRWATATLGL